MATVKHFEDLRIWQEARELVKEIYTITAGLKDAGLKSQITRASVSVMSNIAEGFERLTNKDFKNFLYIAKGSCGETRSMIIIAEKLKYINQDEYQKLYQLTIDISKLLSGFIKTL